ncbi:hypothetical protein SDC9_202510 [bioreactor metagenome]|uniref:Uncharacterized protein n=1 Tax=bioreactor metagenome TaxID=1076179 RepID=A0A645J5T9_9ZZZZ
MRENRQDEPGFFKSVSPLCTQFAVTEAWNCNREAVYIAFVVLARVYRQLVAWVIVEKSNRRKYTDGLGYLFYNRSLTSRTKDKQIHAFGFNWHRFESRFGRHVACTELFQHIHSI